MRNAFTLLGALLIMASTVQVAAASEHHPPAGRSNHHRAYGQVNRLPDAAPPTRQDYRGGKPPPDETRTCDRYWCYAD
jgi:hypothetical protein